MNGIMKKLYLGIITVMILISAICIEVNAEAGTYSVSCGASHTAILKKDGTLWMTGYNWWGQLGDGTRENKNKPVKVMGNVAQASCGEYHTAILKKDGTLWMTGYNWWGQLGDGTYVNKNKPVQVMSNVAQASCGASHTAILKKDGTLWMTGDNEQGQLGDGTREDKNKPVQVLLQETITPESKKSVSGAAISGINSIYEYTGKAIRPLVNVKLENVTLKENVDYTISYANNTKEGIASITITGKGKYVGTKKVTFQIKKVSASSNVENKMKKSAISLAGGLAKEAKKANGTTTENAVKQLKKLKNELIITGYKGDLPDQVLEAFATAVLETIKAANIDAYETDQNKLAKQIYKQIKAGLRNKSKQITLGQGSKKITYNVNYTIYAQSYMGVSAQVSWAEVTWLDTKRKKHDVRIVSNSSDKGMEDALASYCSVLAQLNKGLWKDFLVKYVTDGWKLADLNTIKKLDDKTVSKFFDRCENLILAIDGDKNAKKALLGDAEGELKQKLSKMTKSEFQNFIKGNIPNGDNMIKAVNQYKKVHDKYNECIKKYENWKKTQKDSDLRKYEEAYQACETVLNTLNEMLEYI